MTGLNRDDLAMFLRSRRNRLRPNEVGLPAGGQRRTPGLRRQEVAQLAGMSVDYYIRLEQARGPHPSRQVLSALARALMLTRDEREYLFRIAGENPPPIVGPSREVPPGIRYLLENLPDSPAYVLDAKYDLLAWNALATYFIGNPAALEGLDRNMIRWIFRQPATDRHWTDESMRAFARGSVADLRAAYARYPGDAGINALVTELLGTSPTFAEMWASQEVEVRRRIVKRVDLPLTGPLEFECQVLHVADTDQRMIVYCAEPDSPTQAAFRRLAQLAAAATGRSTDASSRRPIADDLVPKNITVAGPEASVVWLGPPMLAFCSTAKPDGTSPHRQSRSRRRSSMRQSCCC